MPPETHPDPTSRAKSVARPPSARTAIRQVADRMDAQTFTTVQEAIEFVRATAEEYPGGKSAPPSTRLKELLEVTRDDWITSRTTRSPLGATYCDPVRVLQQRGLSSTVLQAIGDPGSFVPRGDNYHESITSWSGRAVLLVMTTLAGQIANEIAGGTS